MSHAANAMIAHRYGALYGQEPTSEDRILEVARQFVQWIKPLYGIVGVEARAGKTISGAPYVDVQVSTVHPLKLLDQAAAQALQQAGFAGASVSLRPSGSPDVLSFRFSQ